MTVDLFSIYLLSGVDIVIRYIVFYVWASGLCSLYRRLRYIEVRYIEVLFHTFYFNFGRDVEYISFVISRTSLSRGSFNRGSTVYEDIIICMYCIKKEKEEKRKRPGAESVDYPM